MRNTSILDALFPAAEIPQGFTALRGRVTRPPECAERREGELEPGPHWGQIRGFDARARRQHIATVVMPSASDATLMSASVTIGPEPGSNA